MTSFLTVVFAQVSPHDCGGVARASLPSDGNLSAIQRSALDKGAFGHPYTTFALLQIIGAGLPDHDGAIYIDPIPPDVLASRLATITNVEDIYGLLAELQWTLYSPSGSLIEVKWETAGDQNRARQYSFRVRLLTGSGAALPPGHPTMESPVVVLVTAGTVIFVEHGGEVRRMPMSVPTVARMAARLYAQNPLRAG